MNSPIVVSLVIASILLCARSKKSIGKFTEQNVIRECDPFGCGYFGASRGNRNHQGVDIVTFEGESVFSPISGKITRFPFPYANDTNYTGIEIKNETYTVKIFYVDPIENIGEYVNVGDVVGFSQSISSKYGQSMINHIHVEFIENSTGEKLNYVDLI